MFLELSCCIPLQSLNGQLLTFSTNCGLIAGWITVLHDSRYASNSETYPTFDSPYLSVQIRQKVYYGIGWGNLC